MARIDDVAYLRHDQYRTAENLDARIRFHDRFSTNPRGWPRWVFDHLRLAPPASILEIGCGSGSLWQENRSRIPAGWKVVLSDFSPGMAARARRSLPGFPVAMLDAQRLPIREGRFDAVIANHMLYHVPDRAKALFEVRSVLRPGGRLFAATGGRDQFRELIDLVHRFDPTLLLWEGQGPDSFLLDTGHAQLAPWFSEVLLHRYEDSLVVTEAGPLVAYVASKVSLPVERQADLARLVEEEMQRHGGALRISKDYGLFEAVA